jgi:hypothetical protein
MHVHKKIDQNLIISCWLKLALIEWVVGFAKVALGILILELGMWLFIWCFCNLWEGAWTSNCIWQVTCDYSCVWQVASCNHSCIWQIICEHSQKWHSLWMENKCQQNIFSSFDWMYTYLFFTTDMQLIWLPLT